MIDISYRGWFQCRLATDPDPFDEPRGVSGYVHAYAGEPDLDRLIHYQKPAFAREFGPELGVFVIEVAIDSAPVADHPLLGAAVDLLDQAKFEGRNGVVAEDGEEPIFPFHLAIRKGSFELRRAVVASDPTYPYPEFYAASAEGGPEVAALIHEATGVPDLRAVWRQRMAALDKALREGLPEPAATAARERLSFLRAGRALNFFEILMRYEYALRSTTVLSDPDKLLGADADLATPWPLRFWMGGWDADVLCGYASGKLSIPSLAHPTGFSTRSFRRTSIGSRPR
jgi:hypothetical protein